MKKKAYIQPATERMLIQAESIIAVSLNVFIFKDPVTPGSAGTKQRNGDSEYEDVIDLVNP